MAELRPFRGVHYSPDLVKLGGVLSPPYDVIDAAHQEALYGRDLRNIVRLELGKDYADDLPGMRDRYTRAADHLTSWLQMGVLVRDERPALYVTTAEFATIAGTSMTRRGVFGLVPAVPWSRSQLLPHERTLQAPKEDRLSLLRATRMQTSAVLVIAAGAPELHGVLCGLAAGRGLLGGRVDGEVSAEKHVLWRRDDAEGLTTLQAALRGARLFVADGHHRYETAVTYAQERGGGDSAADTPVAFCLVHVVAATDPGLLILPTHRLVRPAPGAAFSVDDLWARLDDSIEVEPMADLQRAVARAAALRETHHAFTVVASDGVAVLSRTRRAAASPRARLDVSVLEQEVLGPAGVGQDAIASGALDYTRDPTQLEAAVRRGRAMLGFVLNPVTVADVIAVAEAGEAMPQKSTYFYPKVPAGLVLNPV